MQNNRSQSQHRPESPQSMVDAIRLYRLSASIRKAWIKASWQPTCQSESAHHSRIITSTCHGYLWLQRPLTNLVRHQIVALAHLTSVSTFISPSSDSMALLTIRGAIAHGNGTAIAVIHGEPHEGTIFSRQGVSSFHARQYSRDKSSTLGQIL